MVSIGTPGTASATRLMLLGAGELGREVAIEALRLGLEVIAVDRYAGAPAMQVAQKSRVISMLDGQALRALIEEEKPDFIVPEIEAIATQTLEELEGEGFHITPTARAVRLTMNREGIRRLAAEELGLLTSPYRFAGTYEEFRVAAREIGFPCLVKPVMSSSGKGQSLMRAEDDLGTAWERAQEGARGGRGRVIVEGFIDFDYEITLLTVRHIDGLTFCDPVGHFQEEGDYRRSWQPQPMSGPALAKARDMAEQVTGALGGRGIFGVELFVKEGKAEEEDKVYFSEVSPRPHDTGLVTCISQNLSEFALHTRALLGLPIPALRQYGAAASAVILPQGESRKPIYHNLEKALREPDTQIMLFGKPDISGHRRMGVALALGRDLAQALDKAQRAARALSVEM
ncbi:MAG: formate-dependent phosphoribosylglycinamide formyltransferase [Desulfovibrio sp.]|nr:formate-dependent phosphoribosylglycinamide formyltransferase [Desulfovibrio sp.]